MRKGFTLVEIIVVITIFSIVSVVTLNAFLTAFKSEQRSNIENAVLQDARYIMETISSEIQNGTIDYEEYFNQCVIGKSCPNVDFKDGGASDYGTNYGYYNWQFYFGGYQDDTTTSNTDGFGTICQSSDGTEYDNPNPLCVTGALSFSEDYNVGQNPSFSRDAGGNAQVGDATIIENGSALCVNGNYQLFVDNGTNIQTKSSNVECSDVDTSTLSFLTMNELYLINEDGNKKTILAREQIGSGADSDYALSKIELDKTDQLTSNSSGLELSYPIYGFKCAADYICTGKDSPIDANGLSPSQTEVTVLRNDPYSVEKGENFFADFVPISPLRVNVKSLKFIISPIEDPYLSYAEPDQDKRQPMVTILIEIEPSKSLKLPFFSPNFSLKLQTTVSAGVTSAIPLSED